MNSRKRALGLVILLAACAAGLQARADQCKLPLAPGRIPNGNVASEQQMINAMEAVRRYNSNVQSYLTCLDLQADKNQLSSDTQLTLHNSAVDRLTRVVDEFNQQVRTFRAKHGYSEHVTAGPGSRPARSASRAARR